MSLKTKLNRMKKHIHIEETNETIISTKNEEDEIPYLEQWLSIGAKPFHFDGNYCFIREVEYPINTVHGLYTFSECEKIVRKWNDAPLSHPLSSKGHNVQDLFFFDTETTGLGGGVGNTIFLLGYARILENKVIVKQHFLPNPGGEIALYQSFLQEVDYTTLVTYNGRAFDWPQVKTRHTLIRNSVPKLPQFGHFDLYHAARRLWKDALPQVRLSTVEKEIIGVKRESDTPGYLAPLLYFDYLQHQNPKGLIGIIKHNELDVLSLITLYTHLSKIILDTDSFSTIEQYEMARWLESLGHKQNAIQIYEQVTKVEATQTPNAKLNLAYMYKREKNFQKALDLFEEILSKTDNHHLRLQAAIELSKLLEHQFKNPTKALTYAYEAYRIWQLVQFKLKKNHKPDIDKRIKRLENKAKHNQKKC